MRNLSILPLVLLAGCASAPAPLTQVPPRLQPAGEKLLAVVPAAGVQVYECRARADGSGHEWAFVAPEADLFDRRGTKIGRHYAGPHWEALDGSRIVASLKERAEAPSPEAIPWLLLSARPAGGAGAFSAVTSIQRLNTVGGMAPRSGCGPASAGAKARVNYTADYYFFVKA